jgi:response regulator RpfG family c-di-GMP phosphodiesterase
MKKPSIFVVDDEVQICTLLTRILQREGYDVRAFSYPQDAVDAVDADPPELVLTDLMMPGMTGLEVVRRIREKAPKVRAVLTTGYASIDTVVDALRSGIDDFVTKPFSVADIRVVVARVLQGARDEPAAPAPSAEPADAPKTAPAAAPEAPVANAALVRRLRDMNLVETIHGLLAEELSAAELLPRCAAVLSAALDARRAALFAPTGAENAFRVRSAISPDGPWTSRLDVGSRALSDVVAGGVGASLDATSLGAAASLFDAGPIAAAPLSPRDPSDEDAGALVVSRPASAKPFESEDLRVLGVVAAAIGDLYRAVRAVERAEDAYFQSLCDVVVATETRTPWFARHGERVRGLSVALARRLGLPENDVETLDMAARLLDLGRVETPDDLLRKAARPTDEEWRALRRQAARADEMVRPLGRLRHVKPIIRHHHENWDGTGYPDGLAGEDIPYLASLVRITDSFAALTEDRAWRPALDEPTAVRRIAEMSGRHFHPQLVAAFAQMRFEADSAEERSP